MKRRPAVHAAAVLAAISATLAGCGGTEDDPEVMTKTETITSTTARETAPRSSGLEPETPSLP